MNAATDTIRSIALYNSTRIQHSLTLEDVLPLRDAASASRYDRNENATTTNTSLQLEKYNMLIPVLVHYLFL